MEDEIVAFVINNDVEALAENQDKIQETANYQIPNDSTKSKINSLSKILPFNNLTLLHVAAYSNSTECFVFLNSNLGFPIDSPSADSFLPLHYACLCGSTEVAYYIFDCMTEEEISSIFEADYKDPTISLAELAIVNSSILILELLEDKGYDLTQVSGTSKLQNVLMRAYSLNSTKCLEWVLKNMSQSSNKESMTPLMLAVAYDQEKAVKILLKSGESNVSYFNKFNQSALSLACYYSNVEYVKEIASYLVDVDLPSCINGQGAVHWICQSKSLEIARILLGKGIDVNRIDENGNVGPCYLGELCSEGFILDMLQLLIKHGFDINLHAPTGTSILGVFVASISKPYKAIDWLLEHGADTNIKSKSNLLIKEQMINIAKRNPKMKAIVDKYHIE